MYVKLCIFDYIIILYCFLQPYCEYPSLAPPKDLEDILKLAQTPEPASLRHIPLENHVRKVEEYTLETERRKRPHTTKLAIFQRNSVESYFGELEMESILEPVATKVGKPPEPPAPPTKCQFDLGSTRNVSLYVKQFSDIFTEDGRRPCKITYQKAGQPHPQVVYTNSYKNNNNNNNNNAPSSSKTTVVSSSATAVTAATSTVTTSSVQVVTNQPPVQIVHPQPRTAQKPQPVVAATTATTPTSTVHLVESQNVVMAQPSVNFNVNVNSSGSIVGISPQQVLTRPQQQVVNVNVRPQQMVLAGPHQRTIRMKQPTLAKLLLTNVSSSGTTSSNVKPITVAVQPQPQQIQQPTDVTTMVASHPGSSNVNVNVHTAPTNVNVNLSTINLEGLLASNANAFNTMAGNSGRGGATTTTMSQATALNILRLNSAAGGGGNLNVSSGTQTMTLQRQLMANGGLHSIVSGSSPNPTQILINSNTSGNGTDNHQQQQMEEISVPDLNALLTGQQIQISGQQQSNDHNVNLNVNLNLNGDQPQQPQVAKIQGGEWNGNAGGANNPNQSPPFLVFISPLRQVSFSSAGQTTGHIQTVPQQANTLNLNVGGQPTATLVNHHHVVTSSTGPIVYETVKSTNSNSGSELVSSSTDGDSSYHQSVSFANPKGDGTTTFTVDNSATSNRHSSTITLNDLLSTPSISSASYPIVVNNNNGLVSGSLSNNSGVATTIVSSTPTLSALLAGSPSADHQHGNLLSPTIGGSSQPTIEGGLTNYGNLLDRLASGITNPNRSGASGLNPIASATPTVVLEHPMLAATLAAAATPTTTRGMGYRQIAPAPSLSPHLINLLGGQAIRIQGVGGNNSAAVNSVSKSPGGSNVTPR